MLLALDTHYWETESLADTAARARVAGVFFQNWRDPEPANEQVLELPQAAPYQPGAFYLRELPGLLALINALAEMPRAVIIDGYVWLDGRREGLGAHLWEALDRQTVVIGVAKSRFEGASAVSTYRRQARRPLFVTSAGLPVEDAARSVIFMHGEHRLPTLLKRADELARGGAADTAAANS